MLEEFACEKKRISNKIHLPTYCTHENLIIGWDKLNIFEIGEESISGKWKKLNQLLTVQLPSERSKTSLMDLMESTADVEGPTQLPLMMSVAALIISTSHVLLRMLAGAMEWKVREEIARGEDPGPR